MHRLSRLSLSLHLAATAAALALCSGCGEAFVVEEEGLYDDLSNLQQQGLVSCNPRSETGYRNGQAFAIEVIDVDGRPVEFETARAYVAMQQAAAGAGVGLRIVSGSAAWPSSSGSTPAT
jgi:hypothetical protein